MLGAELAAAVGVLTRVPVHARGDRSGAAAFGLVGSGIGLLGGLVLVLAAAVGPGPAAVLALVAVAVASGGLHLDGLADTADALVAPTDEAAERARRDPRAGPAGVVAIGAVLALDWSLLVALQGHGSAGAAASLVVAVAVSRAIVAAAPSVARGRFRAGLGEWFAERTTSLDGSVALATAVVLATALALFLVSPGLLVVAGGGVVAGFAATLALLRMRKGLDGDALGAIIELALTGALLTAGMML